MSDSRQAGKSGRTDLWRRTNRFHIKEEYHWTNIQPECVGKKITGTPERSLSQFHWFQERVRPVLFNIFLEKITQKTLTYLQQWEDDWFAYNSEEDAEADTSLLSVSIEGRPLCKSSFADNIDPLGNSEKELQQLTERLKKTAADYGMEISSMKSKILINSIKPRPSYKDEWKSVRRSGPVQILGISTNQG